MTPGREDIRAWQEILSFIGADPGPVDGVWGEQTRRGTLDALAMARGAIPQPMRTSPEGVFALAMHEGIVPGPYLDSVGVWTYGIGHTAAAGAPDPARMRRGMPPPDGLNDAIMDAVRQFRNDLAKYEADVQAELPGIAQHEFDAAVSFHYNTGAIKRANWVKSLKSGDRRNAAAEIMNWVKPPEILERRTAERDMLSLGVYPSGRVTVWNVTETGKVIWKPAREISKAQLMEMMA